MTTASKKEKRSTKINADISALLRARNTLLWVTSREEVRVERALTDAAAAANYKVRYWDCATGLTEVNADGKLASVRGQQNGDPNYVINFIRDSQEKYVYILRDMHKWWDAMTLRGLRSLARLLQSAKKEEARSIILLTPSSEVPPELAGHATVIDYPIPDRAEVEQILDDTIASLPPEMRKGAAPNGMREAAIDAAVGLSAEEIGNCYARSLVMTKTIDPKIVSGEKKRVIAREKVLTWHDPDPRGMAGVGGLDVLKGWLTARKSGFSEKARAYGLPAPKGAMLVGVPGCGKSLTAKCIATAWQMPLLRLDMGALKSKYVGDSEANIRKALSVAEAVAPCVLWLDEIEKALGGLGGEDGGVSKDQLGTVLSWMQEREGAVFVVATANDVSALPPELLRKGRFDEVFFVDLPTATERKEIILTSLAAYGRETKGINIENLVKATNDFTGAEIAAIVPDAMFMAFNDGERAVGTADLIYAAKQVVPLAKTAEEKIVALRTWAKGRARPASTPEATAAARTGRDLDLD